MTLFSLFSVVSSPVLAGGRGYMEVPLGTQKLAPASHDGVRDAGKRKKAYMEQGQVQGDQLPLIVP